MKKDIVNETMKLLNENYFESKLQETSPSQNTPYSIGDNIIEDIVSKEEWRISHLVGDANFCAGTPDDVLEELSYLYGPEEEGTGWTEKEIQPIEDLVNKHRNECKYVAVEFPMFLEEQPTVYIYKIDEDGTILEILDSYIYKNEDTLNESNYKNL